WPCSNSALNPIQTCGLCNYYIMLNLEKFYLFIKHTTYKH
ncbi:MAG: hypothetical protein AVDCRST_MAG96-914, partial [uncultured Segetibacter sp.]